MPALKWTEEAIRAEAAKYSTRQAFRVATSSGARKAAQRYFPGLLDELFGETFEWTEEAIRAEAAKYSGKKDFYRGCQSAYKAALRCGLIDDLFENKLRSWDERSIRIEAAKYDSKIEFAHGSWGAYGAACRIHMIDDLFPNGKRPPWTEEAIRVEAAKYSGKMDFYRNCSGAYSAANKRFPGLLDELFEDKYRSWDERSIRIEAAKYSGKLDFQRNCSGSYGAALLRFPGLLDELFENQTKYTDGDAFYVWRVAGHWFKGLPVYKFGITSARRGAERIHQCAKANDIRATEIHLFETDTAREWERIFHEAFTVVPELGFTDGRTEFRACREEEVRAFVDFVRPAVLQMAA